MATPPQRPGRSKQNYGTPVNFIEAAKRRLGITAFAFDFAADHENAKADRFWGEEEDALQYTGRDWALVADGGWGWLNPEFASIRPWAIRCQQTQVAGGRIALLVPASVGANWFRDHVDGQARVLFLNGRIAFMPDKPQWLYPKDCMLCLFSPDILPGYEVWSWRLTP